MSLTAVKYLQVLVLKLFTYWSLQAERHLFWNEGSRFHLRTQLVSHYRHTDVTVGLSYNCKVHVKQYSDLLPLGVTVTWLWSPSAVSSHTSDGRDRCAHHVIIYLNDFQLDLHVHSQKYFTQTAQSAGLFKNLSFLWMNSILLIHSLHWLNFIFIKYLKIYPSFTIFVQNLIQTHILKQHQIKNI